MLGQIQLRVKMSQKVPKLYFCFVDSNTVLLEPTYCFPSDGKQNECANIVVNEQQETSLLNDRGMWTHPFKKF